MQNAKQFLKTCPVAASALVMALLLSACATQTGTLEAPSSPDVSAPPPPRVSESAPSGGCAIASLGQAVGEQLTEARTRELQAESGARDVRVLTPDSMATMEYREDRLNIELDERGRISAFRCG
ncbi:I78 family peptidase inhibitor [Vreelandella sp. EE22]